MRKNENKSCNSNGCDAGCKHGNILIGVLVAAVLIVGGYFLFVKQDKDAMQKSEMKKVEIMKADEAKKAEMAKAEEVKKTEMMKAEETKKADEMMKTDVSNDGAMMNKEQGDTTVMMKAGTYQKYDASKIANAKTGKVVLFFHASWCPSCKAIDADIKSHLKEIPGDVTILDVDYDTSGDLKKKYAVTTQHTFVQVDANGGELTKWIGSPTLADIVGKLK